MATLGFGRGFGSRLGFSPTEPDPRSLKSDSVFEKVGAGENLA